MKRHHLVTAALLATAILAAGCTTTATEPTPAPPTPTPYGEMLPRVAAVASSETAFDASQAIDGFPNSRWSSQQEDPPQWIYVDLGDTYRITRVVIRWYRPNIDTSGPGFARVYDVEVSDDAETWSRIAGLTDGDGMDDDFTGLSATGRYVRVYGTQYASTGYRLAMYELEVYGESAQ